MEMSKAHSESPRFYMKRPRYSFSQQQQQNGYKEGAYRKPIALIEHTTVSGYPPPEPLPDYDDPEVVASGKYCFICCACCGPRAIACGSHWRSWLRYTFYGIYVLCILVAIPVIVVIYRREVDNVRTRTWLVGGMFAFLSFPVSLQLILLHLLNYTKPRLQLHIIRILWMPPIYAMDAWLSLRFPEGAIYCDTLRELYEAYTIYNFMQYLMNYLQGEFDLVAKLDAKPEAQSNILPVRWCLPMWKPAKRFIFNCRLGVLQYTVIRVATTITAFICELCHVYGEGNWKFTSAYAYLAIVNNVSQTWALYCLVLFYEGMKEELKPVSAFQKFLCVKLVVFATFWQAIVISIVLHFTGTGDQHLVPEHDEKHFSTSLQDLLVCIEMIFAAVAHHFAFSHKPFIDKQAQQIPFCQSFFHSLDVRDVAADLANHAKEIAASTIREDNKADENGGQDNKAVTATDEQAPTTPPEKSHSSLSDHR
ncbi:Transmembrane protein 184C [Hypsibius exemplaris]|uniref:Transmembrane protein 184C n=1 Tax=Hypsibius exemplaris TaxID=2072580 RepID=A0A1W0WJL1_HYPEX|nr:Transmembrane protein 184C [Hypsibius exemplaris]